MAVTILNEDWQAIAEQLNIDPLTVKKVNGGVQLNPGQTIKVPKKSGSDQQRVYKPASDFHLGKQPENQPEKQPNNFSGLFNHNLSGGQNDNSYRQNYTDTIRAPGKAPQAVQSKAPSPLDARNLQTLMDTGQFNAPMFGLQEDQVNRFYPVGSPQQRVNDPTSQFHLGQQPAPQPNPGQQNYTDTIRVPGQAPSTVQSFGPTPLQVNPSGTFSDTTIQKWQQYYASGYNTMPGIDTYVQQYTQFYEMGLQDMFAGDVNAYGDLNTPHIPAALLSTLSVDSVDPQWWDEYGQQYLAEGYSLEYINSMWLASIGYEVSENGNYLEFNPNNASDGPTPASSGGSSSGSGGYGGYKGYGGGGYGGGGYYPSGQRFYDNAIQGLTNWRGMGYA